MFTYSIYRRLTATLTLLALVLLQETWALAGTTGGLSGAVNDEKGAPISGASVTVVSASGEASTKTDAAGHYVFLSLAPDTYTVSASKTGFEPVSQAGISVFADQTITVALSMHRALTEIARVTSKSANDLVKSGTTSDVYSVNAATAEKVAAIGGGSNLNSAYSALASQPGIVVGYGGVGWGQTVFIHGSGYNQIGYEFDGVPVNRAFDNYNANTLSNLGQQELQLVTGGAPAGSSSNTVGGFINQVIRTGTYPGFGNAALGIGGPAFYHSLRTEAGGAAPNRNFSYYVGLLGYNQSIRTGDQFNGGSGLPGQTPIATTWETTTPLPAGMFPFCQPGTGTPPASNATLPSDPGCVGGPFSFALGSPADVYDREAVANFHFAIPHRHDSGRDDVQLLYSGSLQHETWYDSINDKGGGTFVCNVLFGGTGCPTNSLGQPYIPWADALIFAPSVHFGQVVPTGTTLPTQNYYFPSSPTNRPLDAQLDYNARSAYSNSSQIVKFQYQRNINPNSYLRAYGYTFFSDWLQNAPVWGTTYYKLQNELVFPSTPDYELITHTRGGELQYANQIDPHNLLQFTANYTTANVSRFNNGTFRNSSSGSSAATNLVDSSGNCFSYKTGLADTCFSTATAGTFADPTRARYCAAPYGSGTHQCFNATGGVQPAGTNWLVTFTGPRGTLNKVTPKFTSLSLLDQIRAGDKLLINAGLRTDRFEYDLNSTAGADYTFWFRAAQNSYCYDPAAANAAVFVPQPAVGAAPGGTPLFAGLVCPASPINGCTTLHPNGQAQTVTCPNAAPQTVTAKLYTSFTNPQYTVSYVEPRISGTYTMSPDTVLRLSVGRYANPFNTASVEYLDANAARAATFDYQSFWNVGFTSPEHDIKPAVSLNWDASLEHRVKGTDISYKVSPFYRTVSNQTQDSFIGPGFVSQIPTGNEKAYGVEVQVSKGDPSRNGLSGQLSYTYTHARMTFNALGNGQNFIDAINSQVAAYNALTAGGSGSAYTLSNGQRTSLGIAAPCYLAGAPVGTGPTGSFGGATSASYCSSSGSGTAASCVTMSAAGLAAGAVVNPYYCASAQPYYDPHGSYPLYQTFPNYYEPAPGPDYNSTIVWPNVISGWLNYKHNRLSVTPTFQLYEGAIVGANGGAQYGSPLAILGLDPRACGSNQSNVPGVANRGWANYLSCGASSNALGQLFIPNPLTGSFDNFGQYQNPWLLNVNAQLRYDVSPHVTASLVLANVFNRCFGGTKTAWTNANPPNGKGTCAYTSFSGYVGQQPGAGFFLGNSPGDPANPRPYTNNVLYPYQPYGAFLPFSAYFTLQLKL